jgi:hypothetical protein
MSLLASIPGGNRIPYFQNARGHKFIVETFSGTEAEGGYFTDIIIPGGLEGYINDARQNLKPYITIP